MAKTALGLDIGTQYIKYVLLEKSGQNQFRLVSIGMAPAPTRGVTSEASIDHEAIAVTIKKLLKDGSVKNKEVNVALPEAHVFTRIIQVPPLSERELASAIKWEAEQYVPLPLEEVNMDFSIVGESKDKEGNPKLDILLVAGSKKLIETYMKILDMCGLVAVSMETEIISASRALIPPTVEKLPTVVVVNIGAQTTDISILRNGVIAFTRSIPTGGATLTKVLAQDFNFSISQAEEYKRTYGLNKDALEGKVYYSLKPIFTVIVDEIKRSVTFFRNKFPEENVVSIILSGGTAKLPGIIPQIVEMVGIETQVGNPWSRTIRDPQRFAKLDEEGPLFAVALGLAMRD